MSDHFLYEPLHVIEFPVRALVLTVVGFELKIRKLLTVDWTEGSGVGGETDLVIRKELF